MTFRSHAASQGVSEGGALASHPNLLMSLQDITLGFEWGPLCDPHLGKWSGEGSAEQRSGRRKEAREEGLKGLEAKMAKGCNQTEGARSGLSSD